MGAPLSHPQGIVVNRAGTRAYVALSASDQVVVLNLKSRAVLRTIWVGRSAGLGTKPTAVALSPDEQRLFVAESGADELAVIALPGSSTAEGLGVGDRGAHPDGRPAAGGRHHRGPRRTARRARLRVGRGHGHRTQPQGAEPHPGLGPDLLGLLPQRPDVRRLRRVPVHGQDGPRPRRHPAAARRRRGTGPDSGRVTPARAHQRPGGTAGHAPARRRTDQARLLPRAREPHLRPAPGRRPGGQRGPEAHGLRQGRDAEPARPRRPLPAARRVVRQLGGVDPGPLLDRVRGECRTT